MRIAVLILSLILMWPLLFQTALAGLGGELAENEAMSNGAAVGLMMFLLYLLGRAFALGLPRAATVAFALATVLGAAGGAGTAYTDLYVWGGVAFALGVMSFFGAREKRRKAARVERFASPARV